MFIWVFAAESWPLDGSGIIPSFHAVLPFRPMLRSLRPLTGWRWIGLGCALVVGMLSFAGASELLHDHVHEDAATPEHTCAITLFAHGVENPDAAATFVLAPEEVVVTSLRLLAVVAPPVVDRPRRPGRDPPSA